MEKTKLMTRTPGHIEHEHELRLLQEKTSVQEQLVAEKRTALSARTRDLAETQKGLETTRTDDVRASRDSETAAQRVEDVKARIHSVDGTVREVDAVRRELMSALDGAVEETKRAQKREWDIREELTKQELLMSSLRSAATDLRSDLNHRLETQKDIRRTCDKRRMDIRYLQQKHRDQAYETERIRMDLQQLEGELARYTAETDVAQKSALATRVGLMQHQQHELAAITQPMKEAAAKARFSPAVPQHQQDRHRFAAGVESAQDDMERAGRAQLRRIDDLSSKLEQLPEARATPRPISYSVDMPQIPVPQPQSARRQTPSAAAAGAAGGGGGGGGGGASGHPLSNVTTAPLANPPSGLTDYDSLPPPNSVPAPPAAPASSVADDGPSFTHAPSGVVINADDI